MQQEVLASLFRERFGSTPVTILPLEGDGSSRQLFRLVGPGYDTAIGVYGPDAEENRAFLSYSRALRGAGLPVERDAIGGGEKQEEDHRTGTGTTGWVSRGPGGRGRRRGGRR